jgi:hypothetical protein
MSAQGNSTPVTGYDFSGVADRRKQMAAYDALPVTVRRALDEAPFEICCIATLDFYREHGARKTVAEVIESGAAYLKAVSPCQPTAHFSPTIPTARPASAPRRKTRSVPRSCRSALTIPVVAGC